MSVISSDPAFNDGSDWFTMTSLKPFLELNNIKPRKLKYPSQYWTDKDFKGTVVNQTLSSLLGGSLEIMLTVPLNAVTLVTPPSYLLPDLYTNLQNSEIYFLLLFFWKCRICLF